MHNCNKFSRCYKTSFAIQSFLVVHQWKESSKQAVKSQRGKVHTDGVVVGCSLAGTLSERGIKGGKSKNTTPKEKNFCDTLKRRRERVTECPCSIPFARVGDRRHATEIFCRSGLEIFGFYGWGFQDGSHIVHELFFGVNHQLCESVRYPH